MSFVFLGSSFRRISARTSLPQPAIKQVWLDAGGLGYLSYNRKITTSW